VVYSRKPKDDYVQAYVPPDNLNNGLLHPRCLDYLDPLIKLLSLFEDLQREIAPVYKQLKEHSKHAQELKSELSKTKPDISEMALISSEATGMAHDFTSTRMKRLEKLMNRASRIGYRVNRDYYERLNTPGARRVPEPEILHNTRFYFLRRVGFLAGKIEILMNALSEIKQGYLDN